jgi:hypothetical protein
MSDNRKIDSSLEVEQAPFWSLTAYINKSYCNKHNYDFKYINTFYGDPSTGNGLYNCRSPTGAIRHAAWAKILSVLSCMQSNCYDYIVYIDTDCIFKNISRTLDSIVSEHLDAEFFFMNDKPWSQVLPCSGFFVCKVSEFAKEFLSTWYNVNIPENDTKHPWEQNALYKIWTCNSKFILLDEWMFQEDPGQFLRHIGSHESHLRQVYFSNHVKNMEPIHGSYKSVLSQIETSSLNTANSN